MDGRGRYPDNNLIERLWRNLRQEAIYLEEIHDGFAAWRVIKNWMAFYNSDHPHSALDWQNTRRRILSRHRTIESSMKSQHDIP